MVESFRGRRKGGRASRESRLSEVGQVADADRDPGRVAAIRAKLRAWYDEARRPLPWREDHDAYRILVSETMLVQTTVTAVVPFFERFLGRFPDVFALAAASEDEVLKAWEGLGYYRRARQLHAAARAIVNVHGGVVPRDPEALRALPGVGRYIAGAVLSFAYDLPAPILEANTQRVVARWLGWRGELTTTETQNRLWTAAERLVPETGAGAFNQAFMELGALICTPRTPSCLICPVAAECRSRELGIQEEVPVVRPKAPPLIAAEAAALVFHERRILIVRRARGGLWENFWEFPTIHVSGADPAGRAFEEGTVTLDEGLRRIARIDARIGEVVKTLNYTVTRHRVRLDAYLGVSMGGEPQPGEGFSEAVWELPSNLARYTFSSPGRKLIDWVVRAGVRESELEEG